MSEIGIICDAEIPGGSKIEIELLEDVDSDGEFENRDSIEVESGEHLYILDGLTGRRDSDYETEIHIKRSLIAEDPRISSLQILIPGYSENSQMDLRAILDKHGQMNYFLEQMKNGDPGAFRYNLSGFLAGARSIEELLDKETEFGIQCWAEEQWIVDLDSFMRDHRNNAMHLGKPVNSGFRPGTGHAHSIDFDSEEGDSEYKQEYLFFDVPDTILKAVEEDLPQVELADSCKSFSDSPIAKSLPVVPLCELYFKIYHSRRIDWLKSRGDVSVQIEGDQ